MHVEQKINQVTSVGLFLFNYQDDARSNKHKVLIFCPKGQILKGGLLAVSTVCVSLNDRNTVVRHVHKDPPTQFLPKSRAVLRASIFERNGSKRL